MLICQIATKFGVVYKIQIIFGKSDTEKREKENECTHGSLKHVNSKEVTKYSHFEFRLKSTAHRILEAWKTEAK